MYSCSGPSEIGTLYTFITEKSLYSGQSLRPYTLNESLRRTLQGTKYCYPEFVSEVSLYSNVVHMPGHPC